MIKSESLSIWRCRSTIPSKPSSSLLDLAAEGRLILAWVFGQDGELVMGGRAGNGVMSTCRRWTMHLAVAHCSGWPNTCPAPWEASMWGQQAWFALLRWRSLPSSQACQRLIKNTTRASFGFPRGHSLEVIGIIRWSSLE